MMRLFNKTTEKRLPEPELKRISIDNLVFAPYQRELKQSKVNKIANNFMPDVVGIALVSFRGGIFYCLDAQHRIMALKKLGYTDIMCQVLTGLTYEEECVRFNVLNTGRTQLTANQVFHCRVEAKDELALELVELFKKYRFDYNKNCGMKADNLIGAVSKFVRMQKSYGNGMVERVLRTIRNAWYGDKMSLSSAIITGLSTFFAENNDVDEDVLVKALEKIIPSMLIASANNYVKCDMVRMGRTDSACYHIAKIVKQCYDEELINPKSGRSRRK